jgi:hypothetical protein
MRKTLSTRLAVLFGAGALMAAACGDNIKPGGADDDDDDDDTTPIDAEVPDMEPPPVFTGTITVLEASVFGAPQAGQGIQVAATFLQDGGVPPAYEETAGSPIGCKVWEYTPAQAVDVGVDQGTVSITVDNPDAHPITGDPDIPDCTFVADRGYLCIDTVDTGPAAIERVMTSGTTCAAQILRVRDLSGPFTFTALDGRYISFTGAANALFPDGQPFPVVPTPAGAEASSASVIYIVHPAVTAGTITPENPDACIDLATLAASGMHTTLGGVGPIPGFPRSGATAEGFLADDATVTVALTAGGGSDIPSFSVDFPGATHSPGDDFDLDGASTALFAPVQAGGQGIPLTGAAFTISCAGSPGCDMTQGNPPTGDGVVLNIETTDADLTGVPATTMPPPMTKAVQVRCASLGSDTASVTAAASAFLASSGATKLQATFIRGSLSGNPEGTVNIVAGHAITTFQVIPTTKK